MQLEGVGQPMISTDVPFAAYAVGLIYASVCTSLTDDEATARINAQHPTGLDRPWVHAAEPFASGQPNGCPCNTRPRSHRHLLFTC